jgi:hypothetical protein
MESEWRIELDAYIDLGMPIILFIVVTLAVDLGLPIAIFIQRLYFSWGWQRLETSLDMDATSTSLTWTGETLGTGTKSISTHESDEAPGALIFHPDGEKRPSHAPGSSISPGSGPSSIRRAQAIPGLPERARGLRTKQTGAKPPRIFACVPAGRVAPTCRREWEVVVVIV